jgi:hypothetical protein
VPVLDSGALVAKATPNKHTYCSWSLARFCEVAEYGGTLRWKPSFTPSTLVAKRSNPCLHPSLPVNDVKGLIAIPGKSAQTRDRNCRTRVSTSFAWRIEHCGESNHGGTLS